MMSSWQSVTSIFVFFSQISSILAAEATSSDLVSSYYQIYKYQGNSQLAMYPVQLHDVPQEITQKLHPYGLNFTSLPSLLQRALIWDNGYALGDDRSLAKIYTRCLSNSSGASMDKLAIDKQQIEKAECEVKNCSSKSTATSAWSFSSDCGPTQLDNIVQCACTSVKTTADDEPVWATEQQVTINVSRIPEALLRRHTWTDQVAGRSAILFAIHTSSESPDISFSSSCDQNSRPSLTIPCIQYRAADDRWCRPKSSSLMTKWLNEYVNTLHEPIDSSVSADSSSSFTSDGNFTSADTNATRLEHDGISPSSWNHTIPVLVVGGAALIVTIVAVFVYLRRRSDKRKAILQISAQQFSLSSSSSNERLNDSRQNPLIDKEERFTKPRSMHDFLELLSSPTACESSELSLSLAESLTSGSPNGITSSGSSILKALANEPHVKNAQISFNLLQFHHILARSSRSEVWLCVLRDRCVAVKRLHKELRKNVSEMKAFLRSIQLTAPLQHPSILDFIGITWSSQQNLCLVTEYLELGDLEEYLRQSKPIKTQGEVFEDFLSVSLSWRREKMQLLLDITRGLIYLHEHDILHGDLKARNVLLSSCLDAKLTGFGDSSQPNKNFAISSQQGSGMTPYWTAPEVLTGKEHTQKADIYSLGVVIAELDTHQTPYANAVTAAGGRMPSTHVLQHIMSGHLKPTMSSTCPEEVVDLAEWCLHHDPSVRPSARDVVQTLRSIPGVNLDEFSL